MADLWTAFREGDHDRVIAEASAALTANGALDVLHILALSLIHKGHPAGPRVADGVLAMTNAPHIAVNLSVILLEAGYVEEAERAAREGIERNPTHAELHFVLGNALMKRAACSDAAVAFRQALAFDEAHDDARVNLGNALLAAGVLDAAIACYERILDKHPQHALAGLNRTNALRELDPQRADLEAKYRLIDHVPEARLSLSYLRLAAGDYEEGWRLYQSRWDCDVTASFRAGMRWPRLPSLDAARGQKVLLTPEGGYGDVLHFVRYAPLLAAEGAQVTLAVEPPLQRLLSHSFPMLPLTASREEAGPQDYECSLMDLPFIFGTTLETIPGTLPYLFADDAGGLAPRGTKARVGLVWAAGRPLADPGSQRFNRMRSIPLADLAPLSSVEGVEFVSLQAGPEAEQQAPEGMVLHRPLTPGDDFFETARIVRDLDLVVTVCTSVAHLAGGLGVPVWVLNSYGGCWRWMRGREDTPWYPGVMRLFNQPKDDPDWTTTVGRLRRALVARTKRR